jgi:two-component system, OmpR family, sensor histidine kinase BaeS
MQLKLFSKFFIALFFTSLAILLLWISVIYFKVSSNFREYIDHFELELQHDLITELKQVYRTSDNWDLLRNNPSLWMDILSQTFARNPLPQKRFKPFKGIPPELEEFKHEFEGMERETRQLLMKKPIRFERYFRLVLLDESKRGVVERVKSLDSYLLKPVTDHGEIIGWLGMRKARRFSNPMDINFIQNQLRLVFIISFGIIILGGLVSFLLSRHLLAPIKLLTEGTKSISERRFSTRIQVKSGDELGELAAGFNTMADTLEQYEESRKKWITDISHELGTPLSVLRGEIEAIQDGIRKMDDKNLASIHAEVMHLSKIVNDLKYLSLAETGGLSMNKTPLDPMSVVLNTLTLYENRLREKQIGIQVVSEPHKYHLVNADKDRLQQVFSNILENVLRYSNSPGLIKAGDILENDRLTIFFEDSGPGVPEESLPYLFTRLYRVDLSRNREKGGTGLGLAICKHIIEAHQGSITALNGQDQGLRIEIEFPIIKT